MKKLAIGFVTLLTLSTAATAQFDITTERHQTIIDSLGKKYHKNVIGYMHSVTINPVPRQNLVIFYLDKKGEMTDSAVWMKVLKSEAKEQTKTDCKRHQNRPAGSLSIYYYDPSGVSGGTYIGYLYKGAFVKVKPYEYVECAVPSWAFRILQNDAVLNKYLNGYGLGSSFNGTIN